MKKMIQTIKVSAFVLAGAWSACSPLACVTTSAADAQFSTLIRAYNELGDGRWVDAWQDFQHVQKWSTNELALLIQNSAGDQEASLDRSLAAADALARLGHREQALVRSDNIISNHVGAPLAYEFKAMVLLQGNRPDEAAGVLDWGVTVGAGSAHNRLLRAYVELRCNRFSAARGLLETNWPALSSSFIAYNTRGFLNVIDGKFEDGIKDFEKSLAMNPHFMPAQNNIRFASMARAGAIFGSNAANLGISDAKGLLGASGTFALSMNYNQQSGFGMGFQGVANLQTSQWLNRSGLFARSDTTLEDANDTGTVSVQSVLSGHADAPLDASVDSGKTLELTCPLIIWK
jgi:hypothetical protein